MGADEIDNATGELVKQAREHMDLGMYAEAIPLFQKIIEINPLADNKIHAFIKIGDCYGAIATQHDWNGEKEYAEDAYKEARAYYSAALKIDRDNEEALFCRGMANQYVGDLEAALGDYDHVIECSPNNERAYTNKGICLLNKNSFEEALECFKKAAELSPESHCTHGNVGIAYLAQGKPAEALTYFQKQAALDAGPEPLVRIAQSYRMMSNYAEAIAAAEAALKINKEYARAHEELGTNMYAVNQFLRASMDFLRAFKHGEQKDLLDRAFEAVKESVHAKTVTKFFLQHDAGLITLDELLQNMNDIIDARQEGGD